MTKPLAQEIFIQSWIHKLLFQITHHQRSFRWQKNWVVTAILRIIKTLPSHCFIIYKLLIERYATRSCMKIRLTKPEWISAIFSSAWKKNTNRLRCNISASNFFFFFWKIVFFHTQVKKIHLKYDAKLLMSFSLKIW